ncbi:hypothetical protein [Pseudomonas aeruginosa]|uniref:hypothetical protein n=1 Tax=Pseudomonas aeruginosa TaxID=287 RepID=UPI001ED99E0A|nr:hypothetical protein [Pseudomonas aeruginosa]
MKADAAIAPRGHADRQRDQLFRLGVECAVGDRCLAHLTKTLHDLRHSLVQGRQVSHHVLRQLPVTCRHRELLMVLEHRI